MRRILFSAVFGLGFVIACSVMPAMPESNRAVLRLAIEIASDEQRVEVLNLLGEFAQQHGLAVTDDSASATEVHGRPAVFRVYKDSAGGAVIVSDIKSPNVLGVGVHLASKGPNAAGLDEDLIRHLRQFLDGPFTINPHL